MSAPAPRRRPSAAVVIATLALVVAAGPPTYAAAASIARNSVGTAQLKNNAVTSAKVKNGTLTRSDLSAATRAQRVVIGTISSNDRPFQDPIPTGGVVGSLSGRYGSGKLSMPSAGRLVVTGYVILNNTDGTYVRTAECDVLVDGQKQGGSGVIYMQAFYSTSFDVQAVAPVAAGRHDVAVSCDSGSANFVNMRVTVLGLTNG